MTKTETRYAELRADGNSLIGVALRYGDVAVISGQPERFEPGAFGDVAALDVVLNRQHDRRAPLARTGGGGLILSDSSESLRMAAELPNTRDAADTLELVRTGVLRGLSVEFRAIREALEHGVRVIQEAVLTGLGVVDRPAYTESTVQTRQLEIVETRQGRTIRGRFPYGERFTVLDGERVRKSQYKQRVFEKSIQSEINEILLYISEGRFSRPIASKRAGSLRFTDSEHELRFQAAAADLSYLDDFAANLEAGTVRYVIRPNISIPPPEVVAKPYRDFPEGPENPGVFVREFLDVRLNSLTISPRPQGAGSVQVRQFSPWL